MPKRLLNNRIKGIGISDAFLVLFHNVVSLLSIFGNCYMSEI